MSWSAIVGQHLAVRLLRQAVAAGKVSHAYLFAGPEGVGKRKVAVELAKTLNCLHPDPDRGACDGCASCLKVSGPDSFHPDIQIVQPDGRFVKTDQMRELQAEMYARPTEGRCRIAIVNGADRMNPEAANRVLKLLEEPPAHVVLLLLTENLSGVLPTIISRCQVVNFPPLAAEDVSRMLQSGEALDVVQANLYAALSGGSIGKATDMARDPEVSQLRLEIFRLLADLPSMDDAALLGLAEALDKQRERLDGWFDLLLVWLRDALVYTQAGSTHLLLNADQLEDVKELAERYGPGKLMAMVDSVLEIRWRIQRNANARLALDVLLLRLQGQAR